MRFAFLAATLVLGATTATAQSQKPAPLVKPTPQVKTPQVKIPRGKPTKQGMVPSNLPGARNANSTNLNALVGGSDDCNTPDAISGVGTFAEPSCTTFAAALENQRVLNKKFPDTAPGDRGLGCRRANSLAG